MISSINEQSIFIAALCRQLWGPLSFLSGTLSPYDDNKSPDSLCTTISRRLRCTLHSQSCPKSLQCTSNSFAISCHFFPKTKSDVSNLENPTVVGKESEGSPPRAVGATEVSSSCCDSLHLLLGTAYLACPACP